MQRGGGAGNGSSVLGQMRHRQVQTEASGATVGVRVCGARSGTCSSKRQFISFGRLEISCEETLAGDCVTEKYFLALSHPAVDE